jgi:hypothetical protein
MKSITLFWIVIAGLTFIGLICYGIFLKKMGDAPRAIKLGNRIFTIIGVLFFWILYIPDRTNYHLDFDSSDWEEYGVPQNDSLMFLSRWDNGEQRYSSWSYDSIRHYSKTVEYDMFDIYKIEDLFINRIEDLELIMIFIKPNIIRDERRLNILQKINGRTTEIIDTLDLPQTKELLTSWGFSDDLFKYDKERYFGK